MCPSDFVVLGTVATVERRVEGDFLAIVELALCDGALDFRTYAGIRHAICRQLTTNLFPILTVETDTGHTLVGGKDDVAFGIVEGFPFALFIS